MTLKPDEYLKMIEDVREDGPRVANSLIIRALTSDRLEERNVAAILAARRGVSR